ncbi:hypothetical protein ALC62_08592 [Cyphomyrmex costatus]|uniref:Uncharacterized protein n=1 Tax=Cyphomyrmex costatus TaxID=456900 RepID=A0A151IGS1_9HYME|nr:hypothetical protein ALC62_08592 [Cyphomyrmex costatus]
MLNERVRSVGFGEPLAISEAHLSLLAFVARKGGEPRETSDIMRISSLLNGRREAQAAEYLQRHSIAGTGHWCNLLPKAEPSGHADKNRARDDIEKSRRPGEQRSRKSRIDFSTMEDGTSSKRTEITPRRLIRLRICDVKSSCVGSRCAPVTASASDGTACALGAPPSDHPTIIFGIHHHHHSVPPPPPRHHHYYYYNTTTTTTAVDDATRCTTTTRATLPTHHATFLYARRHTIATGYHHHHPNDVDVAVNDADDDDDDAIHKCSNVTSRSLVVYWYMCARGRASQRPRNSVYRSRHRRRRRHRLWSNCTFYVRARILSLFRPSLSLSLSLSLSSSLLSRSLFLCTCDDIQRVQSAAKVSTSFVDSI